MLFRKSFQEIHQSDSEEWGLSKDLRSHLGSLESELQFLSKLSGISIRNYCKNTEDLTSTEMAEKSKQFFLLLASPNDFQNLYVFQLGIDPDLTPVKVLGLNH